jgi:hypothetical protein
MRKVMRGGILTYVPSFKSPSNAMACTCGLFPYLRRVRETIIVS